MKISHRSHPILDVLKRGYLDFDSISWADVDKFKKLAHSPIGFNGYVKEARENIYWVSLPFAEAMDKARPKLLQANVMTNLNSSCGVFIFKSLSYVYKFANRPEDGTVYIEVCGFINDKLCYYFEAGGKWQGEGIASAEGNHREVVGEIYKKLVTADGFAIVISALMFMQFSELEVRVVNGNSKANSVGSNKEKVVNESEFKVKILDSTWFVTTIRSDGFKVSGHFRWQPFGPGRTEKKLIYISDFEKEGYTRKAIIDATGNK